MNINFVPKLEKEGKIKKLGNVKAAESCILMVFLLLKRICMN